MIIDKCCGIIELRHGLVILAIVELSSSIGQFSYSYCDPPAGNLVLVYVTSALGIVASSFLLFGAIKSSRKCLLSHMVARTIEMVMSIICGILIFVALSNNQSNQQCNKETDIILGICFLGEYKATNHYDVEVPEFLQHLSSLIFFCARNLLEILLTKKLTRKCKIFIYRKICRRILLSSLCAYFL